jgi:hypothetical protein
MRGRELAVVVRPYPSQWERHIVLGDRWRIFVRPVKPSDDRLFRDLLAHVNKEDLRLRFFDSIKEFSPQFIAKLTVLDYARAMAFIAIDETSGETLGVVRLHAEAAHESAEYAILLRSDLKGRGLGWSLMQSNHRVCKIRRAETHTGPDSSRKYPHAENVPRVGIRGQDRRRGSRLARCRTRP